jgi:mRNA interferase RelE/StbE
LTYAVELRARAEKELNRLPLPLRERIYEAIIALSLDPRPPGSKKLHGEFDGQYRIRVGTYRVLYEIHDDVLVIVVVSVDHRREAYR